MISIGEYLARMDAQRKGCPLTQLILNGTVSPDSLKVLPTPYAYVRPLLRPIYPTLLFRKLRVMNSKVRGTIIPHSSKDKLPASSAKIVFWDET